MGAERPVAFCSGAPLMQVGAVHCRITQSQNTLGFWLVAETEKRWG